MKKELAEQLIATELLNRNVELLELKLNSTSLKNEVKYYSRALNQSLESDFDQFSNILQSVVDSFYFNHYIVDRFMPFSIVDLEVARKHNLSLLNSMKKLLKFVN